MDDCPFPRCPMPRLCDAKHECMGRQPSDSHLFRCTICGGTFAKQRSDEEALAEAMRDFPGIKAESVRPVCNECFQDVTEERVYGEREKSN